MSHIVARKEKYIESTARKFLATTMICSLSFHCLYQLGILSFYYANKKQIVELFCINRNEPVNVCQGSCYLEKMIEFGDEENKEAPSQNIPIQHICYYLLSYYIIPEVSIDILKNIWMDIDQLNWPYHFHQKIFQPPKV